MNGDKCGDETGNEGDSQTTEQHVQSHFTVTIYPHHANGEQLYQ